MKLTLKKSEVLGDWYVIERAEHDGRSWVERTGPNSASLRCSSRFSDADVEGTAAEMLTIAGAIEQRNSAMHRRCAVAVDGPEVHFWSPRNSQEHGIVSLSEADALAALIRAIIEGNAPCEEAEL